MNLFLRISIVLTVLALTGCKWNDDASGSSGVLYAPFNLEAQAESYSSISLTWDDDNTNALGFIIFRREGKAGKYIMVEQTYYEEYLDEDLSSNTTYYYYVKAYNNSNRSPPSNIARDHTYSYTFFDFVIDVIFSSDDDEDEDDGGYGPVYD